MFHIDDPFNEPNWSVVQEFTHKHLWDIPEQDTTQDASLQKSVNFL